MQTREVLEALRGAARELGSAVPSQPGTPTAADGLGVDAPPSSANLLLQISALHKGFLALSEAFMEELEQRATEREEHRAAVESVRRECAAKLRGCAGLQADVQHLAAASGQAAAGQAALQQWCRQLEGQLAELRSRQAEEQERARAAAADAAAAALQRHVEAAVAQQLAAAQQRWAAEALPPLLRPLQEAVEATAELVAQVATDVGRLSEQLAWLARRCDGAEAAQARQEPRLHLLEERSKERHGGGSAGAPVTLEQLHQAVLSLQLAQSRLYGTVQQVRQQQEQLQQQGPRQGIPEHFTEAAEEMEALRQTLAAVAEQQAQQGETTKDLVQSVLADVTSLARHTKALDKELRSVRREAQHTQQALLHSSSSFSKALGIPSPIGPFTSFPPQP